MGIEWHEGVGVREITRFPALCDEGDAVGVKVYLTEWEAEQSHMAGCVRLFMLQHKDHLKYVSKNLPISVELKMYLPHLGAKGVTQAEFLRCAVQGAFASGMPRDAEEYTKLAEAGRGHLYEFAEQLGEVLEEVVEISREVEGFIEGVSEDKHLGEIAEDLRGQLDWLLRDGFLLEAGWSRVLRYKSYFVGMQQRLAKLKSLPVMRDLEKMDKVLDVYLLEEWRLAQFVPETMVKGAMSLKKVKAGLEKVRIL